MYSSLSIYITSTKNYTYPTLCAAEFTLFDKKRNKFITVPIKKEALEASQSQRYMNQATLSLLNFASQFKFKLVCTEKTETMEASAMPSTKKENAMDEGDILSTHIYYFETPPLQDDVFALLHQICDF